MSAFVFERRPKFDGDDLVEHGAFSAVLHVVCSSHPNLEAAQCENVRESSEWSFKSAKSSVSSRNSSAGRSDERRIKEGRGMDERRGGERKGEEQRENWRTARIEVEEK